MNRSRSASLLPAFALALFLPAWAVAQSGQEKQDSPTAVGEAGQPYGRISESRIEQ